jgi:hypothetical protein
VSAPTFPISLVKEVSAISAVAGVWTLTLSNVDGIIVGSKGSVGGFTNNQWNRPTLTVTTVNTTTKKITFSHANTTLAEVEQWAQFHLSVSWITLAELEAQLGYDFEGDDIAWADLQVLAANEYAFVARRNAGYEDHPGIVPGDKVKTGVIQYAQTLIRTRGAVDGFASFDQQSFAGVPGQSLGQIMSLLGVRRAQVG